MRAPLIRAFLVIGGVSAACAWTWPGAFPEGDPVAVLVHYTPTKTTRLRPIEATSEPQTEREPEIQL